MRRFTLLAGLVVVALALATRGATAAEPGAYDVVVYGGTSGAVAAAIQAKKMGKSVVLVSPAKHLGGLTSGGLGWTDSGNKDVVGGVAREFYRRIRRHYDKPESWVHQKRDDYEQYRK